jgi:PAS domain S-box-containing protein
VRSIKCKFEAELFAILYASLPDAVVLTNAKGEILNVNPHGEDLFGYSRAELLGHLVEVLVPQRFRAAHGGQRNSYHREPRLRAMGAGLDLHGQRKDGSEFPVDIMLSPVDTSEAASSSRPRLTAANEALPCYLKIASTQEAYWHPGS